MFPLFIDLKRKKCVVVGGGRVAKRKIGTLLEFGAEIVVVSPDITAGIRQLEAEGRLTVREKEYSPEDIREAFLVIAATADSGVNEKVWEDTAARSILVNVADNPEKCTFVFPSVVRRGEVVVGITTSAGFPALSKHLREQIDALLPEDIGRAADLLKEAREQLLKDARAGSFLSTGSVGDITRRQSADSPDESGSMEISGRNGSGGKDVVDRLLKEVLACCHSDKMSEAEARIEKILEECRNEESHTGGEPGKQTGNGSDRMGDS